MDNKNNRSFYWEVKDFLNKKPETFEPKKHSLKESISGILNENKIFRQSSYIEETHATQDVSKYLRAWTGEEKKYTPKNISYAKNSLANPFQLINEIAINNQTTATNVYGQPTRSHQRADGTWEDDEGNLVGSSVDPNSPNFVGPQNDAQQPMLYPPEEDEGQPDYGDDGSPTREDIQDKELTSTVNQRTANQTAAMQKPSTGPNVDDMIKSYRDAYGMRAGWGEGGGAAGAAARAADRHARSDAIRASTLNLRAEQDRLNRITRTGGTLSAEDAARLQDIKGALNRPQTQFGNPGQFGMTPSERQVAQYKAPPGSVTSNTTNTTTQASSQTAGPGPGKTINAMTPEQIAAANNPAKGGQSGIFGAPNSTLTGGQVAAKVPGASPSTPSAATPGASPKPAPASTPPQKPQPQGDRRVDGNDEGAPSVRIAPNGNAYSPMPDWVKNRQQSGTPTPASVPPAQSNTSSTIGVGSAQPSTPAAQRSPGQAGAANTLGMGTTPPAAPQRSPGQAGAANTLGMGTTPPPQETESEATKRARQTLMR